MGYTIGEDLCHAKNWAESSECPHLFNVENNETVSPICVESAKSNIIG
jgi:hypothetical protein